MIGYYKKKLSIKSFTYSVHHATVDKISPTKPPPRKADVVEDEKIAKLEAENYVEMSHRVKYELVNQ